jgi:protein O-mannosyl-transferase
VLLLLDYWPLGRLAVQQPETGRRAPEPRPQPFRFLLLEKVPFLLLSAATCVVTFYTQQRGGAMNIMAIHPLPYRIANVLIANISYMGKAVWPRDLAFFYPLPEAFPLSHSLAAGAVLACISLVAVLERRRRPYLIVGWLCFLGTLVPVIGLIRVEEQFMADRYTYLPLTGLFILAAWGSWDILWGSRRGRLLLGCSAVALLVACTIATWRQIPTWKDDVSLYTHALAVTPIMPWRTTISAMH